ncbi:hypothetical protein [Hydrogenophaga sp.]|uniref:hypothetical protein n=1 Tax=Hydrogenophaga sp. TaxID=1904254 RepID=UPI0035B4AC96
MAPADASAHSLWIYTMNRCSPSPLLRRTLLALAGLGLCGVALAQNAPRNFPANALRGTMVVTQPPIITMDGKAAQLSPGARIKGPGNLLVLPGTVVGQELLVNYTVEPHGLVHEVWILTEAEAAEKRKRAGQ